MLERPIRSAACALLLLGLTVSAASAQLPPQPLTQEVVYKIHDDPNDPNSAVIFTVWLSLEREEVNGNSVGWAINRIRFRQVGESSDVLWTVFDSNVPTSDGLWWIDHADQADPQLDEFASPPHLQGVATANDSNDDDLEYDFQGCSLAGSGDPWVPTAWLDYEFTIEGQPAAIAYGTDEPIEIEEDDDEELSGG